MNSKKYLLILKIGSAISLLTVFFVFKHLLFPYISSKQLSFNLWLEVLGVFWISFILKYPEFNPFKYKKRLISFGLLAYFGVVLISCFTGVNFHFSFWGNVERMTGFFSIAHFLLLYFIIITVFQNWQDWRWLLSWSVACSTAVAIYGLAIKNPISSIGNTEYVAAYAIFNIYFALILFFKETNRLLRWVYLFPLVFLLIILKNSDISGAFVGFGFSVLCLIGLLVILAKNKKLKIFSAIFLVLAIASTAWLFANQKSDFVKNSAILRPISDISISKNTFQTRLISWRAGLSDFKNHPFLGTGFGNYAIIFDKYFDPIFYSHTSSETYFDHAHNNLVDVVSTTGILGLLTYLAIFLFAIYYLIQGYREDKIGFFDFIFLFCLLVAYFVQNLAVFDSLPTYICLMITLGYIYWLARGGESVVVVEKKSDNREIAILAIAGLVAFFSIYQFSVKPFLMLNKTIDATIAIYQKDPIGGLLAERKAMSYGTVFDSDSRTSFIRYFSGPMGQALLKTIPKEKGQEIFNFCIELAEKNLAYNLQDSMAQSNLAEVYEANAVFNYESQEKFFEFSDKALNAMDEAIKASPRRVTLFFTKAQMLFTRGETDRAIATLHYAISLNKDFPNGYCNLGQILFYLNREAEGYTALNQCLDLGGAESFNATAFLKKIIAEYVGKKDYARAVLIEERIVRLEPDISQNWVNMARLYEKIGEREKALDAAYKAAELDPKLKAEVEQFQASIK